MPFMLVNLSVANFFLNLEERLLGGIVAYYGKKKISGCTFLRDGHYGWAFLSFGLSPAL